MLSDILPRYSYVYSPRRRDAHTSVSRKWRQVGLCWYVVRVVDIVPLSLGFAARAIYRITDKVARGNLYDALVSNSFPIARWERKLRIFPSRINNVLQLMLTRDTIYNISTRSNFNHIWKYEAKVRRRIWISRAWNCEWNEYSKNIPKLWITWIKRKTFAKFSNVTRCVYNIIGENWQDSSITSLPSPPPRNTETEDGTRQRF